LYLGNVLAFFFAVLLRKPVVVTQHASVIPYSSALLRGLLGLANRLFGKLVLANASCCLFISPKAMSYFMRIVRFRSSPKYVPNGVDTSIFRPLMTHHREHVRAKLGCQPDRPMALFVGRFIELKRLDLMRELVSAFPSVHWMFLGSGPDDPKQWNLPNCQSVGSLPHAEIAQYYQAADLLVLPSEGEGFPLVVQESMACGTPVLITHDTAKGAPGVENVAFTADATADSLREAVRTIMNDPERLAQQRHVVAEFAQTRWNWERCADRYLEIFQRLTLRVDHRSMG